MTFEMKSNVSNTRMCNAKLKTPYCLMRGTERPAKSHQYVCCHLSEPGVLFLILIESLRFLALFRRNGGEYRDNFIWAFVLLLNV